MIATDVLGYHRIDPPQDRLAGTGVRKPDTFKRDAPVAKR